jgi:hypothetical protein
MAALYHASVGTLNPDERPPQNVPPTQPFVDCCGHQMVNVSVDESYGWGQE